MAGDFELRTKYQFLGLIEKRDRWNALKNDPSAQQRYEHLVGMLWARQNCALEDYLCKSSKVQGPLEAGALTPSPLALSPDTGERVAVRPGDGDKRTGLALPNTDLDPELWQKERMDEGRALHLARHVEAARCILHYSRSQNSLSSSDLLEIHRLMLEGLDPNAGKYRDTVIRPLGEGHDPIEPEMVPYVVENALEWFNSDSFHEMHEVEKTALVLIKFIDIWPFEQGNGRTLRLFSNFFLLKAGYPPAVIPPERANQYGIAIQNALKFHTQPLIDLLTDSVSRSLQYCLREVVPPLSLPVLQ